MTRQEFSDAFSTLLNSYNSQAQFGEQASHREIVLDEYEKSVLLTQAQDLIVKSYFDGALNPQGQGFDDSTRRQVDFSSLINVEELSKVSQPYNRFDDRGIIFRLPQKVTVDQETQEEHATTNVLFILNEKLIEQVCTKSYVPKVEYWTKDVIDEETIVREEPEEAEANGYYYIKEADEFWSKEGEENVTVDPEDESWTHHPEQGYWYKLKEDRKDQDPEPDVEEAEKTYTYVLVSPAEPAEYKPIGTYVIVPISYKEYDREMSKPFAQPLKKQAWRLFQNGAVGFDVYSELIPKHNLHEVKQDPTTETKGDVRFIYKIRYVKRPDPIILETLPDDLTIDGEQIESDCKLNPILHIDILNKAVELAISTRGTVPQSNQNKQ